MDKLGLKITKIWLEENNFTALQKMKMSKDFNVDMIVNVAQYTYPTFRLNLECKRTDNEEPIYESNAPKNLKFDYYIEAKGIDEYDNKPEWSELYTIENIKLSTDFNDKNWRKQLESEMKEKAEYYAEKLKLSLTELNF